MIEDTFKVHAVPNMVTGTLDLYIVIETDPYNRKVAKPISLEFEPLDPGADARPTLRLIHPVAGAFLKAMAVAASGAGHKPDAEARAEGQLQATVRHLEDLRKLLKLGDGENGPSHLEVRR